MGGEEGENGSLPSRGGSDATSICDGQAGLPVPVRPRQVCDIAEVLRDPFPEWIVSRWRPPLPGRNITRAAPGGASEDTLLRYSIPLRRIKLPHNALRACFPSFRLRNS